MKSTPERTIRVMLGLRQEDIAKRAGVSRQLVSALERGERRGLGPGAEQVYEELACLASGAMDQIKRELMAIKVLQEKP